MPASHSAGSVPSQGSPRKICSEPSGTGKVYSRVLVPLQMLHFGYPLSVDMKLMLHSCRRMRSQNFPFVSVTLTDVQVSTSLS